MRRIPAVTIVLPVWNRERFVGPCIQSVLSQTFVDFELLIVDDGSTDRTPNVIREYVQRDSRIRVMRQKNAGCYAARNLALAATRSELTAIIDSDDVALPQRLERQAAFLHAHPEYAAVGTWALFTDPYLVPNHVAKTPVEHEMIDQRHLAGSPGALIHGTAMCRTRLMRRVGGYREAPSSADYDLMLKLAEVGRLGNLPAVLQQVRTHYGSISSSMRGDQLARAVQYATEAAQRRGISPLVDRPAPSAALPHDAILSAAQQARSWALHAIKARQWRVARRHACASLRHEPMNRESWRVLRWSLSG